MRSGTRSKRPSAERRRGNHSAQSDAGGTYAVGDPPYSEHPRIAARRELAEIPIVLSLAKCGVGSRPILDERKVRNAEHAQIIGSLRRQTRQRWCRATEQLDAVEQ